VTNHGYKQKRGNNKLEIILILEKANKFKERL
jgi:hypothetical protein